ncbi:MAG: DUF6797 domain-containing protein [Planctomycetota bacterium]
MRILDASLVSLLLATTAVAQGQQWPYSMDFGPSLMTTFESGGLAGTVEKGLVVRLGGGNGAREAAVAFDTELLRMSVAWTDGWLRLRGTAYDGSHGPFPSRRGQVLAETRTAAGWSRAGSFADPRSIPHGPLPREWGQYLGHRRVGDQILIDYRIGDMVVHEHFALDESGPVPMLRRTLELGASTVPQRMLVLDGPANAGRSSTSSDGAQRMAQLQWQPQPVLPVELEATTVAWDTLALGAPSAVDYLDTNSGSGATIAFVPAFAPAHGKSADASGDDLLLPLLMDGKASANDDDWQGSVWFDKHKVDGRDTDRGRFVVDLKDSVDVSRVQTYSWHKGGRSQQRYVLYGANGEADAAAKDPQKAGWTQIARVDSRPLGSGDKHCVGVHRESGLGTFRQLLFDVQSGGAFFCEVDVFAGETKAGVDVNGRPARNALAVLHGSKGVALDVEQGRIIMDVPPHEEPLRVALTLALVGNDAVAAVGEMLQAPRDVAALPSGAGKTRWPETIVTKGVRGSDDGAFAVDTITIPFENPYGSRMRTGAFDFFSDGRAAVSTWNGDVWVVSGIDDDLDELTWKRFATGLFDPLGLRIVDDVVYVHGRDGLTKLFDDNGDGEADRYECFNNQVYITAAFHEFAFDLQTDADGNFYFSKGAPVNPGGRGFMKIVPHHGTILKVSKEGDAIEAVATGMRAPNGIGVGPNGVLTSGDNEGTYMPRCRLNWIEKPGFYAGVKDTAHRDDVPEQPDLPLCWMPMEVDNSSGGQVWVNGSGWPDLQGRLLHNSYGTCSTYLVLPERVEGRMQGGVVRLPANYSSSCMRGRFSPLDGELYVIGLKGWQTKAARDGGFHRVRRTQQPLPVPVGLKTCKDGVYLTFAQPLDAETAADTESFGVEVWNYRYSQNYGSPEISVIEPEREVAQGKPNRDALAIRSAKLSPDGRTVFLQVDGMRAVNQMKITWDMDSAGGQLLRGELHNTIHALASNPGFPKGE